MDSSQVNAAPAERDPRQSVDLIRRGIALRATDIHISPFGDEYEVRLRIDGKNRTLLSPFEGRCPSNYGAVEA